MNELESHVLDTIGENVNDPDVFTDDSTGLAQIRDSLNHAIEEIALVTGFYHRTIHIPLRASWPFIRIELSNDTIGWYDSIFLHGIKRPLDQVSLQYLKTYNPQWLRNTGNPERYVPLNHNVLIIHPVPATNNDMLIVNATMVPGNYSESTDRIKLRNRYKWAAVYYAVSEYWASRGDAKSAIDSYARYLRDIKEIKYNPVNYNRQYQTVKDGERINEMVRYPQKN